MAPLRGAIERLTPAIDIPDLLAEVEAWTGLAAELTHAAGATPRIADLRQHLHAALLAWGLNLGPTRMAGCCPLSYRQIAWATEWSLGDEQLEAANELLVDYLHRLQSSQRYGRGEFSSSDGQRSAARGHAATADPLAREFGYRHGALTVLNWVTDQYSQYGTKVVSVAEREAIHTLEEILHTKLPIAEHTTDTHGATELVFALFDLLGLRFIPRLRDAGDLRLHRLGPPTGLPVDAVLRSKARPERITNAVEPSRNSQPRTSGADRADRRFPASRRQSPRSGDTPHGRPRVRSICRGWLRRGHARAV